MAHPGAIGDDRSGPVAESFPRESGASLYILVQIQAGPPLFALTGVAQPRETGAAKRVRRSWSEAKALTDWGRAEAPCATADRA